MTEQPSAEVKLTYRPTGTSGRVSVTAYLPDGTTHTDEFRIVSAARREKFIGKLCAGRPGLDPEALGVELERAAIDAANAPVIPGVDEDDRPRSRDELYAGMDEHTEALLAETPPGVIAEADAMLAAPDLMDRVLADLASLGVVGESTLAQSLCLIGVSRLLERPLSAVTQGTSSSGKSFLIERVSRCVPDEAVVRATDMTPNALYYLPPDGLLHKLVVAGERSRAKRDERAEATRALREMISERELRKVLPVPVKKDGVDRIETKILHRIGPIAFVESTTQTSLFDEDANRCLLLSTDEGPEQTRRVTEAAARVAREGGTSAPGVLARHHAMQRMLRRVEVRIPYAGDIARAMPSQRPEARRAISHVFSMIRAAALLHQRQRSSGPLAHGDVIEASIFDYALVRPLLVGPIERMLGGGLTPAVANFGRRLRDTYGHLHFSSTTAREKDPILKSRGKVNEYLNELADAGCVTCVEESKGSKPAVWCVSGDIPDGAAAWLPKACDLGGAS